MLWMILAVVAVAVAVAFAVAGQHEDRTRNRPSRGATGAAWEGQNPDLWAAVATLPPDSGNRVPCALCQSRWTHPAHPCTYVARAVTRSNANGQGTAWRATIYRRDATPGTDKPWRICPHDDHAQPDDATICAWVALRRAQTWGSLTPFVRHGKRRVGFEPYGGVSRPPNIRWLSDYAWNEKLAAALHRCVYCDGPGPFEKDHAQPSKRYGLNHAVNIVPACLTCNRGKGAKTVEEYLAWRRERGRPVRDLDLATVLAAGLPDGIYEAEQRRLLLIRARKGAVPGWT